MADAHHEAQYDLNVATIYVHLDHECYPKVAVVRSETLAVRALSKSVVAEREVKAGIRQQDLQRIDFDLFTRAA